MKNYKVQIFVGLLALMVLLPQSTFAYETTSQNTVRLNNDTVIHTITYRFGFLNRGLYMSIGAERDLEEDTVSPYVGYEIRKNGEPYSSGNSSAVVLSKAKIKDNQYYLKAGEGTEFTLFTVLNLPLEDKADKFSLKITHLPFAIVKDNDSDKTYLKAGGLETYITPEG